MTFHRVGFAASAQATQVTPQVARLEFRLKSRLESTLAVKIVLLLKNSIAGKHDLAKFLGHKTVSGELHKQIKRSLEMDVIEMTIPDKPNSSKQQYRLTVKGKALLEEKDTP